MAEKPEMVKVESWILYLGDYDTEEPAFYYNPSTDAFDRKFTTVCAFHSEREAKVKELDLNLEGLQIAKGTFDFPREALIEIVTQVFEESGLIEGNETKKLKTKRGN
ncbi:hypothetical protein ON064_04000 [Planococcus sp. A6]|uniref:hypothetical protein n=1 Tax=Planococcus sp. A6 TaxID=2992760 RepID=UPI00237A5823|nr:hypothetical protein [Planococcus sp. A6]MDE0582208.1 hypothetical protein [Planococcus sp. A6]